MKTREELLELIPKGGICAEIGVFKGDFSRVIHQTITPKRFFLVDIFEGITCSGDKHGNNIVYIDLSIPYEDLKKEYIKMSEVEIVKSNSKNFFENIPDNFLDFIYIDGDHSYEGCKLDIEYSRKKVKNNGIIAGHDYCDRFYGTVRAVNEFVSEYNLNFKVTTEDGCPSYYIKNVK